MSDELTASGGFERNEFAFLCEPMTPFYDVLMPKPERAVPDVEKWRALARRYRSPFEFWLAGYPEPWEYYDLDTWPNFDLFPRATRFAQRCAAIRERITDTIQVARHGLPEPCYHEEY